MSIRRQARRRGRSVVESLEQRRLLAVSSAVWDVTASSHLGGTAGDDAVRGAVIQPDGTIALAANIGNAAPGGVSPILLNGATETSAGAIVRLAADGQSVLSVTRLSTRVLDLASDDAGNLFVALHTDGFVKLDPAASSLLYTKSVGELGITNVQRIDAGPSGYAAVLGGGSLDSGSSLGDTVKLYDPSGGLISTITNGKWKNDVALHEASQTVIYTGFRNATDSASNLPVQISYYRGHAFDGTTKYTGYDWSGSASDPGYLNSPTNNMADTRGYRASIGKDGKLYVAFESAGGNNIFRYSPFNINQSVSLVGGDRFQSTYGIVDQHITFVGRYEPGTGALIAGQELVGRLETDAANSVRIGGGNLTADADGRVYVVGSSAWGLPMAPHKLSPHVAARPGFNPGVNGNYLGGAYLWVLEPDMSSRSYVTRLTGGTARAIAVAPNAGASNKVVFGGNTTDELYVVNPTQPSRSGSGDGFFGVIGSTAATPGNLAPVAAVSIETIEVAEGQFTIRFDASATTDANNDPLTYRWHFGNGTTATGAIVEQTFTSGAVANVTLTVRDGQGGWSHEFIKLSPPTTRLTVRLGTGEVHQPIVFDASGTTSLTYTPTELSYVWDFGDGNTGAGITPSHVYTRPGLFEAKLTVTDPLGSNVTITRPVAIAARGGFARRLDLNNNTGNTAPGYIGVPVQQYTPAAGHGWEFVDGNYNSSGITGGDPLFGDYHDYSKYPSVFADGTFLVDVPNGNYAVVIRLGHRNGHTYPGILAEGTRELTNVGVSGDNQTTSRTFLATVTDGQLSLTFLREWWFVSAIEVVDIGNSLNEWAGNTFRANGAGAPAGSKVVFDIPGGESGLSYQWDLGNGQTATGPQAVGQFDAPGLYPVTLTVPDASGARSIIDFGGDMIGSSVGFTGVRRLPGLDLDGDGLADDTTTHIPFGHERGAHFVSGGSSRTRFFGGIGNIQIDNPAGSTGMATAQLTNSGTADYFEVRDQPSANSIHRGLVLVSKADFLAGGHAQRVSFDATSNISLKFRTWDGGASAVGRFVVQVGSQYYVSQSTFSGTGVKGLSPTTVQWAPYNPAGAHELNFDQAAATFANVSLDDIRAIGFLYERETPSTARVWYAFDQFQVSANLSPVTYMLPIGEPATRVSISAGNATASEQGEQPGTFVIARTGSTTDPLTVLYSLSGSASSDDYTSSTPLTGQVIIPAGQSEVVITITPIDDALVEGTEQLTLALLDNTAYLADSPAGATLTILDNDTAIAAPATVVASAFSPRRIDLSWSDVAGESGYRIERSNDGGSSWSVVTNVGANVTSHVDRGLTPNTAYQYRVLTNEAGLLSAPSVVGSTLTPAAIIDDRFTLNTVGVWNFNGFGALGNPTEEYVASGNDTNGLVSHDGALRSRGFHTGTSSTQAVLHWQGTGAMRNLVAGSFSTTGIHATSTAGEARLAIRYGTPDGPRWAISTQSVRTASTTTAPVPGDWQLDAFTWVSLDLNDLATPGAAVPANDVLSWVTGTGVWTRRTGSWMANIMPIIDSFTLSAGQVLPSLTGAFDPIAPSPRVTAVGSLEFDFLRAVNGLSIGSIELTRDGLPVDVTGAQLTTADNQRFTLSGLTSLTGARGVYEIRVNPTGIVDGGGNLLSAAPSATWSKFVLGDMNNDGAVNNLDIAPFVQALTSPAAYAAAFPGVPMPLVGDINGDGAVNNLDIAPFVALLTGGRSAPSPAPLPSRAPLVPARHPSAVPALGLFSEDPLGAVITKPTRG